MALANEGHDLNPSSASSVSLSNRTLGLRTPLKPSPFSLASNHAPSSLSLSQGFLHINPTK